MVIMSFLLLALSVLRFTTTVSAARPWVETPDTGLLTYLGSTVPVAGTLLPLENIVTIPDFDWAAENYLNSSVYAYYRTGAAGEYCSFFLLPTLLFIRISLTGITL